MQQRSSLQALLARGQSARSLKGSGLGLCLRFSLLRREGSIAGRRKEEGASLVVALVAAFVLLLGVGALATRTNFGFIGQIFQAQNRQARDVAESATIEFADTMNREAYRHLLIAGTTNNWTPTKIASDFTNICTAFDNTTDAVSSSGAITVAPTASVYEAFKPGAGFQDRGGGRSFRVESIEFLTQSRSSYVNSSGGFLQQPITGTSYGVVYRSGGERSLIRITVVGRVNLNGRISESRVAKEFEVVPKCCNRSFGANIIGGVNWGRDGRDCLNPGGPANPGVIAGMGGGQVSGSNNQKPILQEDGTALTQAACWNGNESGQASVLTATPNPSCTNGTSAVANISFSPAKLSFNPPIYDHPAGAITAQAVPNANGVIYFDPNQALNSADGNPLNRSSGLVLRRGASITRLNGAALTANSPDPCYVIPNSNRDLPQGRPYTSINCLVTSIRPSASNDIYIDTSAAKINIFFAGNGDYGIGGGNASTARVHSYTDLTGLPSSSCATTSPSSECLIKWPNVAEGSPITAASRLGTFLELCSDRSYDCGEAEEFAIRNLLNFYTQGSGTFNVSGGASGLGFNIYAPNATVAMNGGGGSSNFMGQIWTNNLDIRGNISIRSFSSGAGNSDPGTLAGIPLIDFVARSSTQSSGF